MNRIVLKEEILEEIKSDEALKEKVANAIGISKYSMPRLIYGNDKKLTQAAVLKVLREHLKLKDKDLIAEILITVVA